MKRAIFEYCTLIRRDNQISVWASIRKYSPKKNIISNTPIHHIGLLRSGSFSIKICGIGPEGNVLFIKMYETDSLGKLDIKLPSRQGKHSIEKVEFFECSLFDNIESYLGTYLPIELASPKKIVISDFDKTLIETVFSTPKEIYASLNSPMNIWPPIRESLDIFQGYIANNHLPFVLSASPHFYEVPIRNWLYQQGVFNSSIFLKDYRSIISFTAGVLTPKDIKSQGFYKLNQLLNILLLTGVPDELVLMGDGIESDQDIYLIIQAMLQKKMSPWSIWDKVKKINLFKFTTKQSFEFLNKVYQLSEQLKTSHPPKVSINIRCTPEIVERCKMAKPILKTMTEEKKKIHYYVS